MPTSELPRALGGLSGFPVTPFDDGDAFAAQPYREVIAMIRQGDPGAIFTGCGTGEFASLSLDERLAAAEVALEEVGGSIPVVMGWAGTDPESRKVLRSVKDRGVAALLLMAPSAWAWDGPGIASYYRIIQEEAGLPCIAYLKSTGGHSAGWWVETADALGLAALKDGLGDHDFLAGLLAAGLDPARVINGTPTAEWYAAGYWAVGIRGYSSAVLNFAPLVARAFRDALEAGDAVASRCLLSEFFWPLRQIRGRSRSYAVSLVKAGVVSRGIPAGRTRPPLGWPDASSLADLDRLIERSDVSNMA